MAAYGEIRWPPSSAAGYRQCMGFASLRRHQTTRALRRAAADLDVPVDELHISHYRLWRASSSAHHRPPSELAVTLLFGGWRRACHAARPSHGPDFEATEAEVRDRLYGDKRT